MCCFHEKSSLILMKVLCTILIVLLGAASPLSLRADAIFPCAQQDQPQSRDVVMDQSTPTEMADHTGHFSAHETNQHHDISNSGDSSTIDCVCCGGCVSVCASSACAVIAIGSESLDSVFDNQGDPISAANRIHSNPDPDSLFRPPNPNA